MIKGALNYIWSVEKMILQTRSITTDVNLKEQNKTDNLKESKDGWKQYHPSLTNEQRGVSVHYEQAMNLKVI